MMLGKFLICIFRRIGIILMRNRRFLGVILLMGLFLLGWCTGRCRVLSMDMLMGIPLTATACIKDTGEVTQVRVKAKITDKITTEAAVKKANQ